MIMGASSQRADRELGAIRGKLLAELGELFGLRSSWASLSRGEMHYYDSAPNSTLPPLVLLHGLGGNGRQLAPFVPLLKDQRRVIVPDLFGFSGRSRGAGPALTVRGHAETVAELISLLGLEQVAVMGVSFGGWVAMHLGSRRETRVERLFLVNPAGIGVEAGVELRHLFAARSSVEFEPLYRRIVGGAPFVGVPLLSAALRRGIYRSVCAPGVGELMDSVQMADFVDELLPEIRCRVFLMCARNDRLLPATGPARLLKSVSRAEGVWVEGASHNLGYEAPLAIYLELCRFLGIERPARPSLLRLIGRVRRPPRLTPMSRGDEGG